ncbi:hypothetical protein HAX54_027567 [Datura stramonium]|uniref:Uncharacterized protein n=1 Tax=Datura stramonium TaxID=4076 RepID=A0ABS8S8W5_DATST|nr:hypothetical protein [Datura stramonium]
MAPSLYGPKPKMSGYVTDKSMKKAMKDVLDNLNKLCSQVHVVERGVSSLRADARDLRNRAPIADTYVSFLDEAIAAPHIAWGLIDEC